jgi:hypothetical protein
MSTPDPLAPERNLSVTYYAYHTHPRKVCDIAYDLGAVAVRSFGRAGDRDAWVEERPEYRASLPAGRAEALLAERPALAGQGEALFVRVSAELLARLDTEVERRTRAGPRVTRSDVARDLLTRGLAG